MLVRGEGEAASHFLAMDGTWEQLAATQHGMLSQSQLTGLGVTRGEIRSHLRVRRWAQRTSHVFSTTTGHLSWEQRLWLATLHAGPTSLVGGLTAAKVHGLKGWERDDVTVLVEGRLSFEPLEGVRFVRSRRPLDTMVSRGELPVCQVEPAVLLFAGYEPHRRTAHGAVAAVVQQRLTDVKRLGSWLDRLTPLRRAAELRGLLQDIGGGAQSLAEVDVRRACREWDVVPPLSQRARRDRGGRRRYTDCEWTLPDGRTLVLEVDGGFHDDVLQAAADKSRNRKLTAVDRMVVCCSAYELRYDAGEVMEDLIALGVPRVGSRVLGPAAGSVTSAHDSYWASP